MSPALYSGWGVRTLAEGEARYNPIGYHVGTVWPFDNSFIAWGLRRYGFKDEAARIAAGILDAAEFFDGRLPEAFGGYPRELTKYPVQYPTACSPQAWSTGAPLLFLRTMLGLEPSGDHLIVDPALPVGIGRLELLDIPGRWGTMDAFGRGRVDVHTRPRRTRSQLGVVRQEKTQRRGSGRGSSVAHVRDSAESLGRYDLRSPSQMSESTASTRLLAGNTCLAQHPLVARDKSDLAEHLAEEHGVDRPRLTGLLGSLHQFHEPIDVTIDYGHAPREPGGLIAGRHRRSTPSDRGRSLSAPARSTRERGSRRVLLLAARPRDQRRPTSPQRQKASSTRLSLLGAIL